ncbi:MAG: DUF6398 domain-containing protein [Planctomycetaceae bacterium]
MLLPSDECMLFFKLHGMLMIFVNQRLKLFPDHLSHEKYSTLPPSLQIKVNNAFADNTDLIRPFVDENPFDFSDDELEIVSSWRHLVRGAFIIYRELKGHTVFLSSDDPTIAYGVLALSDPFEVVIGRPLPVMAQTILLPFKDKIVYDGLLNSRNMLFGAGIRRSFNESFKEAKARYGIVTSLPMSNEPPPPPKPPKAKPASKQPSKEEKSEVLQEIISVIDRFCQEHLNEEYALLCRKLAEKLERKRPSPLLQGRPNVWASGIVRAIGGVNFLHDKSQTPYLKATDIDDYFGVTKNSGSAKATAIRKMLRMYQLDPNWTLPSRLDDNPLVWMLEVNGFMMDVRRAPREVQEIAYGKGLIPYIPADREETPTDRPGVSVKDAPKKPSFDPRQRELPLGPTDSADVD